MKKTKHPHSLIVGGSKGLGHCLAVGFLSKGHRVSVISRTSPARGVRHLKADIGDMEQLSPLLCEIVARKEPLHNLVFVQRHRGGGDAWDGEIETSLTATKAIIEALIPKLVRGASIVIVTSVADSFIADEQPVGYHVAKAGLAHMARYYAVTLGARGIRCNCVSPSVFIKDRTKAFHKNPASVHFHEKVVPLGRAARAEEVCNVIAFLCSDEASYVTGQNIAVDGGLSAQAHLSLAEKTLPPVK
ncbi:MAG TPA: SDR family oxidoreductase [Chthoniobacteraceae bacterium]|nr:SDR family oxidoreductase [Chthoniobacteraceae bacterium]